MNQKNCVFEFVLWLRLFLFIFCLFFCGLLPSSFGVTFWSCRCCETISFWPGTFKSSLFYLVLQKPVYMQESNSRISKCDNSICLPHPQKAGSQYGLIWQLPFYSCESYNINIIKYTIYQKILQKPQRHITKASYKMCYLYSKKFCVKQFFVLVNVKLFFFVNL